MGKLSDHAALLQLVLLLHPLDLFIDRTLNHFLVSPVLHHFGVDKGGEWQLDSLGLHVDTDSLLLLSIFDNFSLRKIVIRFLVHSYQLSDRSHLFLFSD